MNFKNLHGWNVVPQEAIRIQKSLAKRINLCPLKPHALKRIAAVDVSFREGKSCAAVCVFRMPDFTLIEQKTLIIKTVYPYIPTLLTFREGPVVLECLKKINTRPDLILFDGQGIVHPRRMGLATHIGIWLELPTIGCAKTPLFGTFTIPPLQKGTFTFIKNRHEIIGAVLRTRNNIKPVFVSAGNRITLQESVRITLRLCRKYRLPEPLRAAHILSKTALKNHIASQLPQ